MSSTFSFLNLRQLVNILGAEIVPLGVAETREASSSSFIELYSKARFPLPESRPVNTASGNSRPSTRPVLMGNGNRSPVNSGRQPG